MNLDKLKEMNKNELLELYTLMVEVDHYDPGTTPAKAAELHNAGITTEDLADIILNRMN
jgi:hypothetical protein